MKLSEYDLVDLRDNFDRLEIKDKEIEPKNETKSNEDNRTMSNNNKEKIESNLINQGKPYFDKQQGSWRKYNWRNDNRNNEFNNFNGNESNLDRMIKVYNTNNINNNKYNNNRNEYLSKFEHFDFVDQNKNLFRNHKTKNFKNKKKNFDKYNSINESQYTNQSQLSSTSYILNAINKRINDKINEPIEHIDLCEDEYEDYGNITSQETNAYTDTIKDIKKTKETIKLTLDNSNVMFLY